MQIGEFAKICNTNISLLRHYDKVGVLIPAYVDKFTGYRHYSEEQIAVFDRITALKDAGFSLQEIKRALETLQSDDELIELFEKKKADIKRTLVNLDSAKKSFVDERLSINVVITESGGAIKAETTRFYSNMQNLARNYVQNLLEEKEYQRISAYRTIAYPDGELVHIECDVVRLGTEKAPLNDNIEIPFENDDVVGKWQVIGEYAVKEDFFGDICVNTDFYGSRIKEIYFLPHGEWFWCYSWTKGKFLGRFGRGDTSVNEYSTEYYNGDRYMFINMKTGCFRLGGRTTVVVLKQLDNVAYSVEDTARRDNVELPFVNDESIIGKWKVFDFCKTKNSFDPLRPYKAKLLWTGVEFFDGGEMSRIYNNGSRVISGNEFISWTKGFVLDKKERVACAYELRRIRGVEYLFIEWKTGDYIYGGIKPQYYVFIRNS